MDPIVYIDRITQQRCIEQVYGENTLRFLYGSNPLGRWLQKLLAKNAFFSSFYGYLQKCSCSKKKILPFIKKYQIDDSEFLDPISSFTSFNDFFTRKLKPQARPIALGSKEAVIPADGRYYVYANVEACSGFIVKGEKFDLGTLLQSQELAERYAQGSMVLGRLCPTDYHRFHFPCDGVPGKTRFINGWLHSVNPVALKQNIHIFSQNKRTLCELDTFAFGKVLIVEFGATSCGTIVETYTPNQPYCKGDEKGYFSFGGSALMLLFEPGRIEFAADLLAATAEGLEIRCLMGQELGVAKN